MLCDLSVDKQVSINGGAFEDADTSAAAVSAHIGDTATWKITVTNTSTEGLTPHGAVYIKDLLPNGVTYGDLYTASAGAYSGHGIAVYWNDKLTRDEVNAVYKWLEANDPTHFCVSPDTAPIRIQRGDAPLDLEDVRERVALAMQATGLTDRLRELGIGPRS